MSAKSLLQLSENEKYTIKAMRWKARTDLQYLAHDILGYPDVQHPLHTPIFNKLQKFPVPDNQQFWDNDKIKGGQWEYTPLLPLYSLPASPGASVHRRVLILDPRSFLKTTINAISHTIQWILNYPDITILITQANIDRAQDILSEIKSKFQYNALFRSLFPEHCPMGKKPGEWGTKSEFDTESRSFLKKGAKEKTVMTASIERGMAGYHFDVMKFSDIVDDENSRSETGLEMVKKKFGDMENLVVRPDSWIDVEGTRYDFSDCYGERIIDFEKQYREEKKEKYWDIHIRGAYELDRKGKTPTYDIEELEYEFLRDPAHITPTNPKGLVAIWDRWNHEALERYRLQHHDVLFACHKLNNPVAVDDISKITFPINRDYPKKIPRELFNKNVRVAYYTTTIDTAEEQKSSSDYTAIVTVAWGADGRAYVCDIRHDRMMPDEIIRQMFLVYARYKPLRMKIEETSYVKGYFAGIGRIQDLGRPVMKDMQTPFDPKKMLQPVNFRLPLEFCPRENNISKKQRIKDTLQPWYKAGDLVFLEDLTCWNMLTKELNQFPKYKHDDILDALSDQFADKPWFGREFERPKPNKEQAFQDAMDQFLGTEPVDWNNVYEPNPVLPLPS